MAASPRPIAPPKALPPVSMASAIPAPVNPLRIAAATATTADSTAAWITREDERRAWDRATAVARFRLPPCVCVVIGRPIRRGAGAVRAVLDIRPPPAPSPRRPRSGHTARPALGQCPPARGVAALRCSVHRVHQYVAMARVMRQPLYRQSIAE